MIDSATCAQDYSSVPTRFPGARPEAPSNGRQVAMEYADFCGRKVATNFADFWCEVHVCMSRPIGLIGAVIGRAFGIVGGAVYKAGKYALGQGAETKKLLDYSIKPARIVGRAFFWGTGVLITPVIASAALAYGVCGVAGAVVGALATPVLAPGYKMVKHCMGERVQGKTLSEHIIKSAEIGSYGFMFLATFGLACALINFAPPVVLYSFIGWEVATCVTRLNMHKMPTWVPM